MSQQPTAKRQPRDDSDDLRRHIDAYSGFVMANIMWAVLAMFVVTLPAATVGLFTVMSERVRSRQPDAIWTFVEAAREKWRSATIVGLIDAAAVGFVALNIAILTRMDAGHPMQIFSGAVTVFSGIVVLSANVYAWPLLALDDVPPRRVIEMSLRLALAYPLPTFGMLLASAAVLAVSLLLPRGVFVLASASAVAYIVAWGSWRVIRRHLTVDELEKYAGDVAAGN